MPAGVWRRSPTRHRRSSSDHIAVTKRLLLGNKFWYAKGGVETYLFELIEELPARGYDVIPFAMRHARNLPSPYSAYSVDEFDYHAAHSWPDKARMAVRMLYSRHAAAKLAAL